jgi:AcrR family transcriptional regulator
MRLVHIPCEGASVSNRTTMPPMAAQAGVGVTEPNIVGGPRTKGEFRVAEILQAARLVFQEDGYAAFSTRRVAARVGITHGNLQYYFRTRDELLRATLEASLREMIEQYGEIAKRVGESASRRCSELVEHIFRDINETELPNFLFEAWAFAHHETYAAELVDEVYSKYRQIFADLLSQINPALTKEECSVRAFVLTAQAGGMMILAHRSGDSERDYAEFVRTTKRYVRKIAGLSGKLLLDGERSDPEHHLLIKEKVRPNDVGLGQPRIGVFGSESHLSHGRLELAAERAGQEALYRRPTMQGKRRESKTNDIVATAANVLASEGYANFTQTRIASKLGLLPSALRHYFPTREDLFVSTIGALMKTYLDRYVEMGRPSDKPPLRRLCEIVEDVFEETCDPRVCRFSLEMFAVAQHSEVSHELFRRVYSTYRAIYADLIREIDDTATARECVARATLIAAQIEGVMIFVGLGSRSLPDLNRVMELMKAMAIDIAYGGRASKSTDTDSGPK